MNLHKEHGKPLVQRVLDQLVAENKLKEKINGKQKCYVANQVREKKLSSWLGSRLLTLDALQFTKKVVLLA